MEFAVFQKMWQKWDTRLQDILRICYRLAVLCFPNLLIELMSPNFQCSIPVFEGLFPLEHDIIIRTLLFRLSEWHALAKLWLHSNDSLAWLDHALKKLSAQVQRFQWKTCEAFKTYELPNEATAWHCQQQALSESGHLVKPISSAACLKPFNILTYKFHALGDYTRSIQMFGTTDSYTTQVVSKLYTVMCNSWLGMNSPRVNLLTDSSRSFIRTPTRTILLWGLLHMSGGLHMSSGLHMFGSSLIVLWLKRKSPKPRYWMTHCQNITISCTLYHAMHSTLQVSLERINQILQWRWVKVQHTLCPLILTPAEFYTEDERPLAILTTWWWIWWRWTFFHWWWAQWSPDHWWFEPGHSIYCPVH